jgi:hypothetical protein
VTGERLEPPPTAEEVAQAQASSPGSRHLVVPIPYQSHRLVPVVSPNSLQVLTGGQYKQMGRARPDLPKIDWSDPQIIAAH